MTNRRSRPFLLALGLTLALSASGCLQPGAPTVAPAAVIQVTVPGEGPVTATAHLALADAEGRQLLALVSPWRKANIHHARVSLYEGEATTALASRDVTQAELGGTLSFNKLKKNTSYRLVTKAWSDAGETSRIDDGAADAASCTTSFATTTDDLIDAGAIKLKLAARTFLGQTTGSAISVTNGVYIDPTAAETGSVNLVSTLAGDGTTGFANGAGASTQFYNPFDLALDAAGNLYVADTFNQRIRKIDKYGNVSTFAGSGTPGYLDGDAATAQFNGPQAVAFDAEGNLYVADCWNHRIRKVTPAGVVSTFAGSGTSGYLDGDATTAQFKLPKGGLEVDASGNVYVADTSNHRIRKITPAGVVSTLAGNGTAGFADGDATTAQFNLPMGLALDAAGNVYVADNWNHRIRKVTPAGDVSTFAGSGTASYQDGAAATAQFHYPSGLAFDAEGTLYVSDWNNNRIRQIAPNGNVGTLAGSGARGHVDGALTAAQFNGPQGLAIDASGNLYVAEYSGHYIRKVQ